MTAEYRVVMLSRVIAALGGVTAPAYTNDEVSDAVWEDLENEIKRQLGISTLEVSALEDKAEVVEIIDEYELPLSLARRIEEINKKASEDRHNGHNNSNNHVFIANIRSGIL